MTSGWRLLLVSHEENPVGGRASHVTDTPERSGWRTATMMYSVCKWRSEAVRSSCPLDAAPGGGLLTRRSEVGITGEDRDSAAAVLRRVVEGSTGPRRQIALIDGKNAVQTSAVVFGPEEPGELAGDGGGHHGADILVGGQLSEPLGQANLCRPRAGHGIGWDTLTDVL